MSHKWLAVVVSVLMASASLAAQSPAVDPITEWSVTASRLAASTRMPPLRTPISLALLHLAMHAAVTAVEDGREHAVLRPARSRPASAVAAAVEAGYQVLMAEFPPEQVAIRATYERLFDAELDARAKAHGISIGAAVAHGLLRQRASDGRNAIVPYTPGTGAGVWVPTPPAFLPENTAFLARVTPFTMNSPSRVRPNGPPRLRSKRWADDFNEVKRRGSRDSAERRPDETATALFWEPLAGTVWPATIRRLAQEQALDLSHSARFQAAAFMAFADALIACWDAKYHFNFWRPVTAIRQGDTDDNDRTEADPVWEPLSITPNFPEYASGHTCATAAVAHTIENYFDRQVPIPARNVVTGEERVYQRADDVVDEVVEARMLLGLHFRSADEDGADIGQRVASRVRRRFLR